MRMFARTLLLIAYTIGLVHATLITSPQRNPTPNLELLQTISACWEMGGATMVVNVLGNLVLLAPLGVIGPWLWGGGKRWELLRVIIGGFVVSVAIEGTQYACGHRMADVDDVLLNTIGAGMGYGAMRGVELARSLGAEASRSWIEGKTIRGGVGLHPSARAIR